MTGYDNTNRFALFKNERKQEERDPDYTGTLNVDGVEFFIDAWRPKEPGGKLKLSGRIKRKQQQAARAASPMERQAPRDLRADLDDEIPF